MSRTHKRIYIEFQRSMTEEYYKAWSKRRTTGLRVSWQYTENSELDPNILGDHIGENREFVKIVNIIYQEERERLSDQFNSEYLTELKTEVKREKSREQQCTVGEVSPAMDSLIAARYQYNDLVNIYYNPEHHDVTEKILEMAADLYFSMVFCPDRFYQDLLDHFPLETVLRSLARILLVASEKRLSDHYSAAKVLFDKTSSLTNLQYRDIAALTTGASELILYPELQNYQVSTDLGEPEM